MKSLIYLLALISLAFGIVKDDEDSYGCKLKEGKDFCCWVNNNGCCKPPLEGQLCTMVITNCCKKKVCDELTGECYYEYSHNYDVDEVDTE